MNDNYWNRRTNRRRMMGGATVFGAGLVSLTAFGCGDDDDAPKSTAAARPAGTTSSGSPATSGSPAPGGSPAAAQPKRGGTLTASINGEPAHLDPHTAGTTASSYGYGLGTVQSGLLKPKALGHKGALIIDGDLAEKWEQPDRTTAVFTLRPNVKWHNVAPVNGRAFTAEDVVYSFKRQIEMKVTASFLSGIKNITAPDAKTVRVELQGPNADFLGGQTSNVIKVVAKEQVDAGGGKLDAGPLIGTGPFIFKSWAKGSTMSFVRNPDYFIPGLPYADALETPLVKDQAQIEAQFLAGKFFYVQNAGGGIGLPNPTVKALDKKKFGVFDAAPTGNMWVMMNVDKPELKDPRIRRALALALDRELVINNVFDGFASFDSIAMVLPDPAWRLPEVELKQKLGQDLKQAKQMLDAAGGLQKQTMNFYESATAQGAAQIVQANFKAIGFETELASVDNVGLTSGIFNPANSKFFTCVTPLSHAPTLTGDLETWYKTGGVRNGSHISDPELDRLIVAQKEELDPGKRKELVLQIQRLIIDKSYNAVLTAGVGKYAYPLTAKNVEPPPGTAESRFYAQVWLDA